VLFTAIGGYILYKVKENENKVSPENDFQARKSLIKVFGIMVSHKFIRVNLIDRC